MGWPWGDQQLLINNHTTKDKSESKSQILYFLPHNFDLLVFQHDKLFLLFFSSIVFNEEIKLWAYRSVLSFLNVSI